MQNRRLMQSALCAGARSLLRTEEIACLRRYPALGELALDYCTEMTAEPVRWPLSKLLHQVARYEICFYLIANHARWRRGSGQLPTLAAAKIPPQASPRQVAGFVASLRRMGLVNAVPAPNNRRVLLLEPTPRLIEEIGRHPRLVVRLYSIVREKPSLQRILTDLDQLEDLLMLAAECETRQPLARMPFPIIGSFARHDCGYLILVALLKAHYARGACDLTYAAFTSWLGVSRAHVAHLLHEARAAGWLNLACGELYKVNPILVDEFEHFLAEQAVHFGNLAEGVVHNN